MTGSEPEPTSIASETPSTSIPSLLRLNPGRKYTHENVTYTSQHFYQQTILWSWVDLQFLAACPNVTWIACLILSGALCITSVVMSSPTPQHLVQCSADLLCNAFAQKGLPVPPFRLVIWLWYFLSDFGLLPLFLCLLLWNLLTHKLGLGLELGDDHFSSPYSAFPQLPVGLTQ